MTQSVTGQIVEIWILYVIGASMIAARIFCRTKLVGYRGYQWDDYLIMALAVSAESLSLDRIRLINCLFL